MCEVLKYWLKTATDPCPTWEAVVAALRSPIVNAKHIAEQLETKYCAPVECIGDASNSPTKVEKSEGIHTLRECTYVQTMVCVNYCANIVGSCIRTWHLRIKFQK